MRPDLVHRVKRRGKNAKYFQQLQRFLVVSNGSSEKDFEDYNWNASAGMDWNAPLFP